MCGALALVTTKTVRWVLVLVLVPVLPAISDKWLQSLVYVEVSESTSRIAYLQSTRRQGSRWRGLRGRARSSRWPHQWRSSRRTSSCRGGGVEHAWQQECTKEEKVKALRAAITCTGCTGCTG